MNLKAALLALVMSAAPYVADAKIKVVTTTTDLRELAREVGGDEVDAESLCKGGQDPHFIEAKPSFMVKVNRADLVLAVGLGLESGWIPSILRGARNPKVNPGATGYFEIGPQLPVIDKASATLTRAQGDVHPEGNPHVTLDPVRAGHAAMLIAERLGKISEPHAKTFIERAKAFQNRMNEKVKAWEAKLEPVKVRKVVTYHKTLTYFLDRFKLEAVTTLEPKPGIPPTASHILNVMKTMKDSGIKLILVENYFDSK
ncbi:MAG TPA: metal ABC transporter substrate-binding protein, partial [Bdellovibrionales bacterium]|nr:metal ABC transporter substrate-binding protein [Bdellovibrionales bacterium]